MGWLVENQITETLPNQTDKNTKKLLDVPKIVACIENGFLATRNVLQTHAWFGGIVSCYWLASHLTVTVVWLHAHIGCWPMDHAFLGMNFRYRYVAFYESKLLSCSFNAQANLQCTRLYFIRSFSEELSFLVDFISSLLVDSFFFIWIIVFMITASTLGYKILVANFSVMNISLSPICPLILILADCFLKRFTRGDPVVDF